MANRSRYDVDDVRTVYMCLRCAQRPTGRMAPGLCDDCSRAEKKEG